MIENVAILYEYEEVLLGKKNSMSGYFFSQTATQNEVNALYVIRYAVENYLHWTPEEVRDKFSWDIIDRMKLDVPMRFIRFPGETDPKEDLFVVAGKLYPGIININSRDLTLAIYKRVLSGELIKFPKGFFDDAQGFIRAAICLQYVLTQKEIFSSIDEMYHCFSSADGTKILIKYKLQAIRCALYKYPIDYLHDALPECDKNEVLYRYYRFRLVYSKEKRLAAKKS